MDVFSDASEMWLLFAMSFVMIGAQKCSFKNENWGEENEIQWECTKRIGRPTKRKDEYLTNDVIRIAVLLPFTGNRMFSLYRVMPAMAVAMAKLEKMNIGPPGDSQGRKLNISFDMSFGNSGCDATFGPIHAFDFYMENKVLRIDE